MFSFISPRTSSKCLTLCPHLCSISHGRNSVPAQSFLQTQTHFSWPFCSYFLFIPSPWCVYMMSAQACLQLQACKCSPRTPSYSATFWAQRPKDSLHVCLPRDAISLYSQTKLLRGPCSALPQLLSQWVQMAGFPISLSTGCMGHSIEPEGFSLES